MMDVALVVDASVWVSAFLPQDVNHHPSHLWLERYLAEGGIILAPPLLMIEIGAAITRRTENRNIARNAIRSLYLSNAIRFMALDDRLIWAAVDIAIDLPLRSGDATYVALARQRNIPLVSWDREQLQRSAHLITTSTPLNYVF